MLQNRINKTNNTKINSTTVNQALPSKSTYLFDITY